MLEYFIEMFSILSLISDASAGFLQDKYPASVIEDASLDTAQLLTKYRYPWERHYVTTADNYILGMYRMPRPLGRPIFLMHGILDSSDTWIFMGPAIGLGYYLYEKGYDVWLGNTRGNRYSRNHTTMDPDANAEFWKYSWHEIGFYDLPAMIDYALMHTNRRRLTYIGHSQGTTTFFVMCSMHPNCGSKISSMHAIAPVVFMKHIKTPLLQVGKACARIFDGKVLELLPHSGLLLQTCFISQQALDTCLQVFFVLMGKERRQANATMWPVVFGHVPAGAAARQVQHYLQLVDSDRFCQYDFGAAENAKRYGRSRPPEYVVENITVPIGLYYTYNDYMTSEIDVERLARLLPNVVAQIRMRKWSHITPVWGINARELLHKHILEVVEKFA